jgi:phosphoenolpyruvate-protein kinase (PTS system EI component)
MVGGVEDIVESRLVLEEAKRALVNERFSFDPGIPLGAMIETPAAALVTDKLADTVDFLSLGTNDLSQYMLATDRDDPAARLERELLHPGIARLIASVAKMAQAKSKRLSICGEMAGNVLCTPLLLGVGLRSFSVAPNRLSVIRAAIRETSVYDSQRVAECVLELESSRAVFEYLCGSKP